MLVKRSLSGGDAVYGRPVMMSVPVGLIMMLNGVCVMVDEYGVSYTPLEYGSAKRLTVVEPLGVFPVIYSINCCPSSGLMVSVVAPAIIVFFK